MENKDNIRYMKNYMKVGIIESEGEKLNTTSITPFTSANSFYHIVDADKSTFKHYNIEPDDLKVKIL